jgi:hypothetical protein
LPVAVPRYIAGTSGFRPQKFRNFLDAALEVSAPASFEDPGQRSAAEFWNSCPVETELLSGARIQNPSAMA